jgi:hypothetical protein
MARTLDMSWVMVIAVAPISTTISRIRSLMTPAMIGSRPVVGSSKKMISGSAAMARASPTRFCIPPDSSAGNRSATSGPARRGAASRSRWRAPRPWGASAGRAAAGKATFCQTVSESNSAAPWNSMPKRARNASRSPAAASWPSTRICRHRAQQAQDAFQQHRLAGARAADDHHAFAARDRQVDAAQHRLGPKALSTPQPSRSSRSCRKEHLGQE